MRDLSNDSIRDRAKFDFIRYSNLWEDADILCTALEPRSGKKILSIMSAGDNALALAAEGADVLAVDLNPAQRACAELKCLAIKTLEPEDLLAFFGILKSNQRLRTFSLLKENLSSETRSFWETRAESLEEGFIHVGKFERYFQLFRRRLLPLVATQAKVASLCKSRSVEERREFYHKEWDTWRWRLLFRIFFSRTVMGRAGRDPEFFKYVEGSIGDRILNRARYGLTELSPHDNPYLQYILWGNYTDALPRFLRPDVLPRVRTAIIEGRVRLAIGEIDQIAIKESSSTKFDGFNLSDIFEYVSESASEAIYKRLLDSASAGARVAYWNMLVPRECPKMLRGRTRPLSELSAELFALDKAFFYSRFIVEEVL